MATLGLFWVSAIGLVALLTAFHIVNAIATRSIRTTGEVPPVDELDQKIELKAAKSLTRNWIRALIVHRFP
jgi:hypothetical protein